MAEAVTRYYEQWLQQSAKLSLPGLIQCPDSCLRHIHTLQEPRVVLEIRWTGDNGLEVSVLPPALLFDGPKGNRDIYEESGDSDGRSAARSADCQTAVYRISFPALCHHSTALPPRTSSSTSLPSASPPLPTSPALFLLPPSTSLGPDPRYTTSLPSKHLGALLTLTLPLTSLYSRILPFPA